MSSSPFSNKYFGRLIDYYTHRKEQKQANEDSRTSKENSIRRVLKKLFSTIALISVVLLAFLLLHFNRQTVAFACFNVLAVCAAYFFGGCAMGFIFAIPKSAQGTPPIVPKDTIPSGQNGTNREDYKDNTSLEEISDWLTKIIIGLSLTQFGQLLQMLNTTSVRISAALQSISGQATDFTVFSYAIILLYGITGLMIGYLWTRIDFQKILYQNKKDIEEINELKEEIGTLQQQKPLAARAANSAANQNLLKQYKEIHDTRLLGLMDTIISKKPVQDKSDPQKNRWGGNREAGNYELTANVTVADIPGLYNIQLIVSTKDGTAIEQPVAFVLHDSFTPTIRLLDPEEKPTVSLKLIAYESFTAAAVLDLVSETEYVQLELDLNAVPDLPAGFYWR